MGLGVRGVAKIAVNERRHEIRGAFDESVAACQLHYADLWPTGLR